MSAAARVKDPTLHGDPLGPGPGSDDVVIESARSWRAIVDSHTCEKVPSDGNEICYLGSLTVLVNGNMAVRESDKLRGGGAPNEVAKGTKSVLIGDIPLGLWNANNAAEFCRDMCSLEKNWSKLSPDERKNAIEDAINRQLAKDGVPSIGFNSTTFSDPNTLGQFDFQSWNLDIKDSLFNQSSLSDSQMRDLANTVYHESRHAEQWYGMARYHGPDAGSANQLATDMAIPQNVADDAFDSPPAAGSYHSVFGGTMYRSAYGPDSAYRNGVLNSLSGGSPTTYKQYRGLPEEQDAWRTGDLMNICTC